MSLSINVLWVFLCGILVLFMQAGFTCLESGLTRSKNSINVALKNMADFGVSITVYWAVGFAMMFGPSISGIVGNGLFFYEPGGTNSNSVEVALFFYEVMFAAAAVTIVSGAVAERMKFSSYLTISAVVSFAIYPIIGHWCWAGVPEENPTGWLAKIGFLDFAGSTVVHSTGGWVALAILFIIGPRIGRFPKDGPPRDIPGSNLPVAILGTLILWVGWLGFNGGSTFKFDAIIPSVLLNTVVAPASGLIAALCISWFREGRAEVGAAINGTLAGLVAITASSNMVTARQAFIIGAIAAFVMTAAQKILEKCKIDDAIGAIPVHLAAGIWGTLAVALFADMSYFQPDTTRVGQFFIQLIGIASVGIWAFTIPYALLNLLNSFNPIRIDAAGEEAGLNISEHGATTELYELYKTMEKQAESGDLSIRIKEEPFTEAGQIATRYNRVLDSVTLESKIAERMAELANLAKQKTEEASHQLKDKLKELDTFQRIAVGRELRMIELKREINELLKDKGEPPKFDLDEISEAQVLAGKAENTNEE